MKVSCPEFTAAVRPMLEQGVGQDEFASAVNARWSSRELCPLLFEPNREVRQLVALVLGMVGDGGSTGCLARALHDPDDHVAELAEHALWSVWFRLGNAAASGPFHEGLDALGAEEPGRALPLFRRAIAADAGFAEARNQAAVCHYLMEEFGPSVVFCQQALARMPMHFGAVAGEGHCYLGLGQVAHAAARYAEAVKINPRLVELRSSLESIEASLGGDASALG